MLIPAGTGTTSGMVNLAGQSTDTTVTAHTIESVWLVNVNFTCLPDCLTVFKSMSNHLASPFSTLAPFAQSNVIKSSRKHGLVVALVTSKPKRISWSVLISRYTSFASTLLYTFSTRARASTKLPITFGASIPKLKPAGIGKVMVAPVVYWQSVTIPMVTFARLLPGFAK